MNAHTKHTPGPWQAVEHTAESYPLPSGVFARVVKQGGHSNEYTICEIYAQGDGKYEPEVTAANAHILAAAPKMYAALTIAEATLRDYGLIADADDIAEVLAKADGRS